MSATAEPPVPGLAWGEGRAGPYAEPPSGADEMWDTAAGKVRPGWLPVLESLSRIPAAELEKRRQDIRRELRQNGVTYNVHGDPKGLNRPWEMDPVPLVIHGAEWEQIETGLTQRAELLNLILRDLYGPRTLIRNRLLPPELVYAHHGFLRACDQLLLPGHHQLLLYAADLARGPDGRMWVISDRTQAPSGSGYALENRSCMARVLPHLFRECQVHRLGGFFQQLRETLLSAGSGLTHRDEPRIVLLTPGPLNETYFEHAYLAAHMGFTLVQGDDLTTRDGHVWLKTLDGLQPVEAILRRIDDPWCDPLELREESRLGITGLVEATRRNNVLIANPLGSSLLENPGMFPFLPGIARHFLGEDLRLPSAATWWCGHRKERDHVLANLSEMVIKPIHNQAQTVFGFRLSEAELEHWRRQIRKYPYLFVGQEHVGFSTTPTLIDGRLEPRRAVLRSFLVARNAGYAAMPGGLAHISLDPAAVSINSRTGGVSKDVWVISDEAEHFAPSWRRAQLVASQQPSSDSLPSRAAENLFWVGRYAERAEGSTRLLRAILQKLNERDEHAEAADAACLLSLLQALAIQTGNEIDTEFAELGLQDASQGHEAILKTAISVTRQGGLPDMLQRLLDASFAVRDLWSSDTWRVIDRIRQDLRELTTSPIDAISGIQSRLDDFITSLVAFTGLTMESMTHEHGWILLELGRRLERGTQIVTQVRACLVPGHGEIVEHLLLESLLSCNESLITHRRRYRSVLEMESVLELLLLDPTNPRSLIYQVEQLREQLADLPRDRPREKSREERLVLDAATTLELCEMEKLLRSEQLTGRHPALEELLDHVGARLSQVSDTLTERLFAHTAAVQQLVTTRTGEEL